MRQEYNALCNAAACGGSLEVVDIVVQAWGRKRDRSTVKTLEGRSR